MLLERERELLVAYGKKLIRHRLTTGTGGNLSIFNREKGLLAITPTGLDYFDSRTEDIVVLQVDGERVEGKREPSSELPMHRIFYQQRQDINVLLCYRLMEKGWKVSESLPANYQCIEYFISNGKISMLWFTYIPDTPPPFPVSTGTCRQFTIWWHLPEMR